MREDGAPCHGTSQKWLQKLSTPVWSYEIAEEVKRNLDNQTYTQYFVMTLTFENESIAKLQKNYSEPGLRLKLIAHYLLVSNDKVANQNELINLGWRK